MASSAARTLPANPRPKRDGERFARAHHAMRDAADDNGDSASSRKKARFDVRNPSTLAAGGDDPDVDAEDAAVLALDEIGRGGAQAKRGAVNIDGFDSDSSDGNFDERAAARARKQKSEMEDEADMFADLEEPDGDAEEGDGGKKKKEVRFIDADEIEGQVANSRAGGHVSADFSVKEKQGEPVSGGKGKAKQPEQHSDNGSSDDDSGGDEERAALAADVDADDLDAVELGAGAKKQHAPRLDAFNMRSEGEEGRFDESGNFVRQAADPDAVHDNWLHGVSKKDMRRAKAAADKREQEQRARDLEDEETSTADILCRLIPLLDRGETVLEALQRLGSGTKRKKVPKWQQKKRAKTESIASNSAMDVDGDGESEKPTRQGQVEAAKDSVEQRRRAAVETITEAADRLLSRGQAEIYDAERELLMRQYVRESGEQWVDPPVEKDDQDGDEVGNGGVGGTKDDIQWEYRWSDARDGGESHGPYNGKTMQAWSGAGYFSESVEFRPVGTGDGNWSRSVNFV